MHEKLKLAALRAMIPRMPFNKTLGMRVARAHKDGVTIEIPLREELMNVAGVLHGGVTATIADAAVGVAIWHHFGGRRRATTTELKINYFRPIERGKVVARSRLLRVGKHLVVGSVEITDADGNSAGFATVTYMLLDAAPAHRGG
ncbi:MAG: PaaI family thioesterase [Candidatus Solibacter usitatus]|nr:PaaI family thioesterase [Candidatus Solibacter usitatus]